MFFQQKAFWLPKDLQRSEEYQDAHDADSVKGVAAIADGVSSSLFAQSWAKLLTKSVVGEPPDTRDEESLPAWLSELRTRWREPIDAEKLAWHQKPKFQTTGAQTTLLWVELCTDLGQAAKGESDLYGYSIGDCCLFHVRGPRVLRTFPFTNSEEFQADPQVLGSIDKKGAPLPKFEELQTTCLNGDLLVLSTDAYAAWAMAYLEAGQTIDWYAYWDFSEDDFRAHVEHLRQQQQIRYDDTTLLLLWVGKPVEEEQTEEAEAEPELEAPVTPPPPVTGAVDGDLDEPPLEAEVVVP